MLFIIKFLSAIILTEAITEIITKADVLEPLRQKIFNRIKEGNFFEWFHNLISCGFCVSVWTGWFVALLLFHKSNIIHSCVDWIFIGLILHRLSNVIHFIIDRINRKKTEVEENYD